MCESLTLRAWEFKGYCQPYPTRRRVNRLVPIDAPQGSAANRSLATATTRGDPPPSLKCETLALPPLLSRDTLPTVSHSSRIDADHGKSRQLLSRGEHNQN